MGLQIKPNIYPIACTVVPLYYVYAIYNIVRGNRSYIREVTFDVISFFMYEIMKT